MFEEIINVQKETNKTLQELLTNVKRSNKILMMVNGVNIMTIVVLLLVLVIR
jgi:CHASE3 domain sensor protein